MIKRRPRTGLGLAVVICVCAGRLSTSVAAEPEVGAEGADRHFQRGVALYIEADYRGALVEFKRAYTLVPNGVVLFNIAESQYQLRDYAGAFATFQQYLVEAPDDSHRALAARNIEELRTRVGELRVVTLPPGATVSVDDRVLGQTPIERPVLVGIGRMNLRAVLPGRPPVVHPVEIAAEDDVLVTMEIPPSPVDLAASASPGTDLDHQSVSRSTLRSAGWAATGILAAGAAVFSVLALRASNDLQHARNDFPTTSETLDHFAHRTRTFSILADSFTAATLAVGGITLYSTINANTQTNGAELTVGFGTLNFDARF